MNIKIKYYDFTTGYSDRLVDRKFPETTSNFIMISVNTGNKENIYFVKYLFSYEMVKSFRGKDLNPYCWSNLISGIVNTFKLPIKNVGNVEIYAIM